MNNRYRIGGVSLVNARTSRRRFRQLTSQIGELRADVRRLEGRLRQSDRRGFLWTFLALCIGMFFQPQPQQPRRAVRHAVNARPVRFAIDVPRVAVTVHRGRG